jgi:hypothetical protein
MRLRFWVAGLTLLGSCAVFVPGVLLIDAGVASAAAPTCVLPAPVGGVITLTSNCDTTVPLTIPNGVTLNGAGFTITAHDVADGSFDGAVLSNAGTSMNVENLNITGTGFTQTQPSGSCGRTTLNGIWFNGASGSVTNVTVTGITESSNCQVGRAIVGNGTAGQTLTIKGTTVSNYNKNGIQATGMTMNVSDSTISSPASLKGVTGQNGLVYISGATGTTSGSTIYGSGYGSDQNANTAVLLFGATNVALTGDTITGNGTDIGVAIASNTVGAVLDGNHIGRTAPDVPDNFGFGVELDPGSTATLTCNTFSGWNTNITGAVQADCGYWLAAADAGVFTFGSAAFHGSGASSHLNAPVVGMASAGSGGYWLVGSDGGVFSFGATFYGSTGNLQLNEPVNGISATADGGGYWFVASDGGIFSFGDARFVGSTGSLPLNAPVVGMAAAKSNAGYWLVGADGGVFSSGLPFFGAG